MRFHRLLRAAAVLVGAASLVLVSAPPAGAAGAPAATAGAPVMNGQATNNPHNTTTTVAPAPTPTPTVASSAPSGGANTSGAYDSNANGSPSLNGGGNGFATGKPAAGSVGNADGKNPPGQRPWDKPGADKNKGYECDANHGIGKGNPAHSACVTPTPPVTVPETPTTPSTVPTQVLGEQITRTIPAASVAGSQLPRTGFPVAGYALVGLGLLAAGGVIWWMAQRRHEGEHMTS